MMFRERPRALCARALAGFSHVPGDAAGIVVHASLPAEPNEPDVAKIQPNRSAAMCERTCLNGGIDERNPARMGIRTL